MKKESDNKNESKIVPDNDKAKKKKNNLARALRSNLMRRKQASQSDNKE